LSGEGIDENHIHARKWATHGTDLDRLIRGVADLDGRLSLAEAVTDRHTPGTLDHIDQFRIQWLTGGHHLLRWVLQLGEIGLHQHAPYGGRAAETGHALLAHLLHQRG